MSKIADEPDYPVEREWRSPPAWKSSDCRGVVFCIDYDQEIDEDSFTREIRSGSFACVVGPISRAECL